MKYVIAYDIGDSRKSLVIGNISIRSGGQKVLSSLPVSRSQLTKIHGVTVTEVDNAVTVADVDVDNPKYVKLNTKSNIAGTKSGPQLTMRQRSALKTK